MLVIGVAAFLALPGFGQSLPTSSEFIKCGNFDKGNANAYWEQESFAGDNLIQKVGASAAYSGRYVARLGGARLTIDTLDQLLGAWPAYEGPATVTFYCRTEAGKSKGSKADTLQVLLLDDQTGQQYPVGAVSPPVSDWSAYSFKISPDDLGLLKGHDYYLRFEASDGSHPNPTAFNIDDVSISLGTASRVSNSPTPQIWATEPPDTLPDDDGDVPYISSPGYDVFIITPHRDLPNTCSCGYPSHRNVTITVSGFSQSDLANVKVKFKVPQAAHAHKGTIVGTPTYDPVTGIGTIVCTVPDSPGGKNYLGPAQVKVKAGQNKKAWAPHYSCDENGNETGFFYGFPNPITNVQLLSSGTPNVVGGETFQVSANGLATFTRYRPNAVNPRCGDRPNKDYIHPAIFVKDPADSRIPKVKVQVNRSDLTNVCGSTVWTSTWTGDGAPAVCDTATPCIKTGTPLELDLINPDNIDDQTDAHGMPQPVYGYYKGTLANAVDFQPPATQPVFAPGDGYGSANSVGFDTDASGNPIDIAIRPLQSATNKVKFHGTNIYRIKNIKNNDGTFWNTDPLLFSGPTWEDDGWGTKFHAWAPPHATQVSMTPYLSTKDDPDPDITTHPGVPFRYVPSFAEVAGHTSTCLENGSGTGCPLSLWVPSNGGVSTIEYLLVGPSEASTVTATVGSCTADTGGDCSKFTLTASATAQSTDGQGRTVVAIKLTYSSTAAAYSGGVHYTLTVASDYGTIETRDVNLYR